MSREEHFVYTQSTVDIKRSKFLLPSFWKGHIFHGDLVPVEITKVMPGDSAKYNLSAFIRTATPPIAPFMDTIRLSFAAFYIPERLIWNKEKEFLGEKTEGYGIQSEVLRPRSISTSMTVSKAEANLTYSRSLATYLGLVRQKTTTLTSPSPISLNPLRAFLQVYNDWFRNENFHAPYLWDHNQTGDASGRLLGTLNGVDVFANSNVPKVCKQLDRFTSCLPWAQKGDPVLLPLGDTAPVIGIDSDKHKILNQVDVWAGFNSVNKPYMGIGYKNDDNHKIEVTLKETADTAVTVNTGLSGGSPAVAPNPGSYGQLVADLSTATAASVNELRLAFATQRYLEALARTGSKYREYIKGIFGVSIGDTTAQMAEYLGGMTIELNIDQVLQTTGYSAGQSTTLGAPGASSTSAASGYLFTKSFAEPGYVVVVAYTKHNRSYGQGIDEIYQDHETLEDYNPKFANIGEIAIKKSNLYFTGEAEDDDIRFGFQEAWSQYKHKKDMVVGYLCPSNSSSQGQWSLADNFATAPSLNADFITEDRANIARVLAGGLASPDYWLDIKFNREFVRPMPLYDIPGLIDHH